METQSDDELERMVLEALEEVSQEEEETHFPKLANVFGSCSMKVSFARGVRCFLPSAAAVVSTEEEAIVIPCLLHM